MGILNFLFGKSKKKIPDVQNIKEEKLEDFFNIDIRNIYQYNPEYTHTETSVTGNKVEHYNLRLKELELGIFDELEVLKIKENEYNIIFKGINNILTKDFSNFLYFYTKKYGLDEMGYGKIEETDYHHIQSHIFSRLWKNLMIDNNQYNNSKGNLEMCIMGIKLKSNKTYNKHSKTS